LVSLLPCFCSLVDGSSTKDKDFKGRGRRGISWGAEDPFSNQSSMEEEEEED